jgi:hypothetical protein
MAVRSNDSIPDIGENVTLRVRPGRVHLFGGDGRSNP